MIMTETMKYPAPCVRWTKCLQWVITAGWVLKVKNQITSSHWQTPLPLPQHRDGAVYILRIIYEDMECLWYHIESSSGLLSGLPIFLPLSVNGKTDSGTDGCSSSLVRRSRWEVSASQHRIHFPFHSSCKSKLADFLCLHIFLSRSHLLNFIISWGSTSCSLINYLKNIHSLSHIARLVNILLLQHRDPAGNALRGLKFGANTAMKLTCCGWSRMNFGIA